MESHLARSSRNRTPAVYIYVASPTDRDAPLVRPLNKPTNPERSGAKAGLDVLMTVTGHNILMFDLNLVISQHADPRVSLESILDPGARSAHHDQTWRLNKPTQRICEYPRRLDDVMLWLIINPSLYLDRAVLHLNLGPYH